MTYAQKDELNQSLQRLAENCIIFLGIVQPCGEAHQKMQEFVQIGLVRQRFSTWWRQYVVEI